MIVIDRCQCFQQTFSSIKDAARETGITTIANLQNHIEFGKNCQLCHPYIKRMLKTGEVVFYEIIKEFPIPQDVKNT